MRRCTTKTAFCGSAPWLGGLGERRWSYLRSVGPRLSLARSVLVLAGTALVGKKKSHSRRYDTLSWMAIAQVTGLHYLCEGEVGEFGLEVSRNPIQLPLESACVACSLARSGVQVAGSANVQKCRSEKVVADTLVHIGDAGAVGADLPVLERRRAAGEHDQAPVFPKGGRHPLLHGGLLNGLRRSTPHSVYGILEG